MAEIREFLKKRKEDGLLRVLFPASVRKEGKITIEGKVYLDFSSNDYLGLSNHPKIISAAKNALDSLGASSTASRLLSGDLQLHHKLEEKTAVFKNKEAALVFNSGYQANVGILSALFGKDDAIFADRLAHASLIDGIILSQAKLFRFQHNDPAHLESLLEKERRKHKKALIVTESVFSMDGDIAPLEELARLKNEFNCLLMVDEAHATGIFGQNGSGVVEEKGLSKDVDLIMGTFGKALAGFGAYLAASKTIVEYLINTCRSFIYSTSLPPAVIAGNIAAIDLISEEPERRKSLLENAEFFRQKLMSAGFKVKGESQIVPLIIGDNLSALKYSEQLKSKGYWAAAIRPPTVPQQEARLRFSINYSHNQDILGKLADELKKIRV